ncbi:hypothetical protein, partial [Paenibacillus alkaliterrae]
GSLILPFGEWWILSYMTYRLEEETQSVDNDSKNDFGSFATFVPSGVFASDSWTKGTRSKIA